MSAGVEALLTPVEVIVYRVALLRSANRLLLQQPAEAADLPRACRALEATGAELTVVIALLQGLRP